MDEDLKDSSESAKRKTEYKPNLNLYLFANLALTALLLIGLWKRKPVWDVSISFPNILLILVIINTILLFKNTGIRNEKKENYDNTSRDLSSLRTLIETSANIDNALLSKILAKLKDISSSESVSLHIIEKSSCHTISTAGIQPSALIGSRFQINDKLIRLHFAGSLGEEEIGKISSSSISFLSSLTELSFIAIPLRLQGSRSGLCIFSTDSNHNELPFSSTDLALFLETFLALVDASKQNKSISYKDQNTSLMYYDFFASSFETEIERSERYKGEMSLFCMSVKGFDNLGAEKRELVSKNVADSLRQSLRGLDLIFLDKNDGDFLAILNETGTEVAEIVANRIQKTFDKLNTKLEFDNGKKPEMFIGTAAYPSEATHGTGLLEKSRDALELGIKENIKFKSYSRKISES